MKIILLDREAELVRAWSQAFEDQEDVEAVKGDYFSRPAEAMVSPANSFGIMDGGLDLAIRNELGVQVQKRAQAIIVEKHHGELPVGCAELIDTDDERWPALIIAPTMRVPENVSRTLNAYLAFRAVLLAAQRANFASVVCCGLGTGIGFMPAQRCAVQMRMALLHTRGPARIPSFNQIHAVHEALRTS